LPESDTSTFTVPGRLTVQGVAKRRAAEGRLVAGVAALADVERFKGRTAHLHKAKAKRWDRKLMPDPVVSLVVDRRSRGRLLIGCLYKIVLASSPTPDFRAR